MWALALGLMIPLLILLIMGPLGGATTQLTASLCVGGGAAVVYLSGTGHLLSRGVWLFVGVLFGAVGFALGAAVFPDTQIGLFFGGVVPIALSALGTMWTRRQADFLAAVLGAGALTGVYATRFNTDPQSLNYSLPIGIGQTVLPLALGFIAAVVVQLLVPTDVRVAEATPAPPAAAETQRAETATREVAQ